MSPVRRVALLVLAAVLAVVSTLGLLACGGSGGSASGDAQQVLSDTFTGSKKIDSGQLDLGIDLRAKDGSTGSVRLGGPFQTRGAGTVPSFDFTLTLGADGQTLDAGFLSTGTAGWASFRGTDYKLDAKTFQQFASGYSSSQKATPSTASSSSLAAFGIDPRRWLKDPKIVGTEDVGGVKTTHITAGIAIAPMIADLNRLLGKAGPVTGQKAVSSLSPAQVTAAAKALRNVKVDVFTGSGDKTMRRIVIDFGLALAPGQTILGMTPSGARISLTFAELNQPQTITPPKSAKPFSELQTQLTGLLGAVNAASGSASGTGTGGGTTTTPSAGGSSSKYLACVQAAGQDLAKVQTCAPLIGQ